MKLFTKVAIGAVAGFTALATLGNISNGQNLASCNAGDVASCHEVFDGNTAKKSMITNKAFLAAQSNKPTATPKAAAPKTAKLSNYEVCLKTQQDLIEFGGDPSKMDCEAVKNYKTPAQRVQAAGGVTFLTRKCEAISKSELKDPRSYRYDTTNVAAMDGWLKVTVSYRATNSFGAVVPGTFACRFDG